MIRDHRTILYVMLLVRVLASVRPATGQPCNASYNSPGGGCSSGSICLYSTNCNSTVPNPCPTTGQTCTLINTTTQVGVCVPGTTTCSPASPCGSGQTCAYVNATSNDGLCVPSCTASSDCPAGQTCMGNACIIAGSCSCQLPGCSPSAVQARTFTFTNNCNYPVYVGAAGNKPDSLNNTAACATNSDCGVDQFCDSSGSDASNPECEYVPVNGTVNVLPGTTCNANIGCTASAPSCTASSATCLCVGGTCSTYCNSTVNQCATVPTNGNGFLLASGQSSSVSVPSDWSGGFWPRTGCPDFSVCQPAGNACSQNSDCCTNDCALQPSGASCTNGTCPTGQTCQSGQCMANVCQPAVGACLTGDCDGALNCNQGASSPVTLAEFTLQPFATNAGAGGTCTGSGQSSCPYGQMCQSGTCVTPTVDSYDISNIDGPNVPTQISPTANTTLTGAWEPGSVTCTSNSDCYQGQANALLVCNTATGQCILPYDCGSPGCSTAASCASFGYSPPSGTTFLGVSSWAYNFQPTGIPCTNSTTCPTGQTCQSGACATTCTGGPGQQGTCAAGQTCTTASNGTCAANYAPQMQAVAPFQCGVNTTPGPPAACTGGPSVQGTCAAGYLCSAATGGTCAPGCTGGPAQGSCPLGFTCASTGICQRPCSVCVSGTCTVTACTSDSACTAPQVCGIAEIVSAAGASLNPAQPQPWVQVCGQPLPGSYFGPGEVCSPPGLSALGPPLSCGSNLDLFGCASSIPSCYTSPGSSSCCGCASWAPGFGSGGPFPNPAGNACQNTNSTWVANAEVPAAISHVAVPTAYSFPYDDPSASFICSGQSSTQQVNYTITYCPGNSPGALVVQGAKAKRRR
jgi:hypothetical protein